jgi:glycosyltransferase involved in cell wall biosynthesis
MASRSLHIAWLGPVPGENSGVPGVATELLAGLADLGHRIDCFFPDVPVGLPPRLADNPNLVFAWSGSRWNWGRWYSRTPLRAFVTGLGYRALGFARLRSTIARHHGTDPYDVIYQFSNIETFGVPRKLARSVPLVIHPECHSAGELRWLLAERHLGRRCQTWYQRALSVAVVAVRALVQRVTIHQASLVICISRVFREHLVNDYRFPPSATLVVPNPVRLTRFGEIKASLGQPPTAVIIGRISARKGVEQIVALSHLLKQREVELCLRVVGGHSLWSDYRPLLRDLEPTNTIYAGQLAADDIPLELRRSDMLIQASKYEPFGLTVAEALAAGVPVVATPEVGAIEGVSGGSVVETPVGDPGALAGAVETMLDRLHRDADGVRRGARADARRLFSPEVVCQLISNALEGLVASDQRGNRTASSKSLGHAESQARLTGHRRAQSRRVQRGRAPYS